MNKQLNLAIGSAPDPAVVQLLEEKLYEYNVQASGIDDGQYLSIILRDDAGEVIAGLYGWTWGQACEIRSLWVNAAQRGQGLGAAILEAAEHEARRRGCTQVILNTHSFQAPEFYKARNYQVIGEYPDYPVGHALILLKKTLAE
jgi:GNAT superfamily N-acetyltransferase